MPNIEPWRKTDRKNVEMGLSEKFSDKKHRKVPGRNLTRLIYRMLATGVGIGAIVLAVLYLYSEKEAWQHLRYVQPSMIVLIAVILFTVMVFNGLVTRDIVAHFGLRLQVREWIGITFVTTLFNYISPFRGGAAVRAIYLKRYHGLPFPKFLSTLAATIAFSLFINAALAGICIIILGIPGDTKGWLALGVCIGIVTILVLGVLFVPVMNREEKGIVGKIAIAVKGWHAINQDQGLKNKLLIWTTINALGNALAFVLAFRIAGWQGEVLVAVVSSAFAKIGSFISIVPGALGVYEAFGAVSAQLIGGHLATALLAILVIRVLSTSIVLIMGTLMLPFLMRSQSIAADPRVD